MLTCMSRVAILFYVLQGATVTWCSSKRLLKGQCCLECRSRCFQRCLNKRCARPLCIYSPCQRAALTRVHEGFTAGSPEMALNLKCL